MNAKNPSDLSSEGSICRKLSVDTNFDRWRRRVRRQRVLIFLKACLHAGKKNRFLAKITATLYVAL